MKLFVPALAALGLALASPAIAQDAAQPAPAPEAAAPAPEATPPAPAPDSSAPAAMPMSNTDTGAAAAPAPTTGDLPTCSASVRDRCTQPAAAERVAAAEYKGGGKDNSAMMHASGAKQGKAIHHRRKR